MSTWQDVLSNEKSQPYFKQIMRHIEQQRRSGVSVFPPPKDVFNAFRYTELNEVKVVILGQDPYHGPNQAHGLCFSVKEGVKIPPSLVNIYKELRQDISEFAMPNHGNLTNWARQGVLLLNTVLTVEQGQAHSHAKIGWEKFTDKVMKVINENAQNVVFLLWGSHAQRKGAIIDRSKHHVLCAPHPSPLSAHRGFFGCKHFSQTNQILTQVDAAPINWQV